MCSTRCSRTKAIEAAIAALVNTERIVSLSAGAIPTDERGDMVVEQMASG